MKKSSLHVALAAFVYFMTACNSTTTETADTAQSSSTDSSAFSLDQERSRINAENAKFMDAIKRGDSAGVAALYTQDALVMPSNYEAVPKDGIASLMGSLMHAGIKEIKLTTDELSGNKDMIAETGKYEMFVDGQKSVDKGKYIVIWKPVDGTWKMYRDMFNSNLPIAKGK